MKQTVLGFAVCGSFCTFAPVLEQMERLAEQGFRIQPILSEVAYSTDTRFGTAQSHRERIERITGCPIWHTVAQAEPIGPKKLLDVLCVAPCTGNTLSKLAAGTADTSVTFACKAHLRNGRPLVLGISTNDGLAAAAVNIGELLGRKHYYFVPFGQDDPEHKPTSLVADYSLLQPAIEAALEGRQLQPLLV